jgi:chaperonin GroEL (HSP60 family)
MPMLLSEGRVEFTSVLATDFEDAVVEAVRKTHDNNIIENIKVVYKEEGHELESTAYVFRITFEN